MSTSLPKFIFHHNKKNILLVLILFFIIITIPVHAWENCPFGEINEPYPGTCGRYIDTDKDNICDYSQPAPEDRSNTDQGSSDLQQAEVTNESQVKSSRGINYYFLPIFAILIFFYLLTWMLSNKKKIKRLQHRKLWNLLLLMTFLVSGVFGIILSIIISYGIRLSFYSDLLFWHVEFGIAMAIISLFHIMWHWKYYQKMIIRKN